MSNGIGSDGELNWLLDDLVTRVAGARDGVVLSADGLLLAKSAGLPAEDAERLAAMSSAMQSLAREAGRHFRGGDVRQTVVELDRAFLLVTAAGSGACLAVLAEAEADIGMIAYEMNLLVVRVGDYLSSAPRVAVTEQPRGR
ncbi:dynein regulation protein LC7 [Saccharopolyspora subtropica]|uniref:Dynein regulation protein LC7 n=1 Tax=Saccharopolyspora thermophila TaxID=89367 RepID=A0A917JLT1_9PSEU|nr:roadblock/LC7 domain-containing protein [Saccharopolyspora subtropica]GGI76537.1 dynein regulation protein LC7 [Saccharopolyspora subtropica]